MIAGNFFDLFKLHNQLKKLSVIEVCTIICDQLTVMISDESDLNIHFKESVNCFLLLLIQFRMDQPELFIL